MKNGLQKESELNGTTNGTRGTTRTIFGDATKAAKGEPQPKKRRLDLDKVLLRERGWSRHHFINMRETKQSRKGRKGETLQPVRRRKKSLFQGKYWFRPIKKAPKVPV